jgi:D-alanyl-D-alanine dipeptidase
MISLLKVNDQVVRLTNLAETNAGFQYDIRYARKDNFMNRKVYTAPHAFLLSHVADDLCAVHRELSKEGYGILIFDGYRPWSVTKLFWDHSSEHDRQFLADPAKGSSHNRGCAVDLSLFDLKTGQPVRMPSDFDEMNEKAYARYTGGHELEREARDLLRRKMEQHHFTGITNEWWHFNHDSHHDWPVMNFTFEEILQAPKSRLPLLER